MAPKRLKMGRRLNSWLCMESGIKLSGMKSGQKIEREQREENFEGCV